MRLRNAAFGAAIAALAAAGCGGGESGSAAGNTSGSGGSSSGTSAGGAGAGGGAGASSATGTSSASGATGGAGTGGGAMCTPGEVVSCYSGPFGTDGVGDCHAGAKTCNAEGTAFGDCMGEITPAAETCTSLGDEDCDGNFNEEGDGCVCVPGAVKLCYSGTPGTAGTGVCTEGVATCDDSGTGFGPCVGEVVPTPDDCSTPADEDCDGVAQLCPVTWAKSFGDASGQFAWSLAADGAGNTVIAGDLDGTIDFGGGALTGLGGTDVFLAKLDAGGNHVWSKQFGNAVLQSGQGVAIGPNGEVAITGFFQGTVNFGGGNLATAGLTDIFVAKFDAAGNHVWSKKFGSSSDDQLGLAVAVDSVGAVIITGSFTGSINFGGGNLVSAGGSDIFVLKLDSAAGAYMWAKRYGDAALVQEGRAIAVDAMNNVLFTGNFQGTVNFGGAAHTSAGGSDAFLTKIDSAGLFLWSKSFGDAQYQTGRGVTADAAGNVIVVGDFGGSVDLGGGALASAGNYDIFAGIFDPLGGTYLHSASFGGPGYDSVSAVAISGADLAITGYVESDAVFGAQKLTGAGGRDILVAKLSSADLTPIWARNFGDASFYQSGQGVGIDPTGNVLFGGYYFGSVDFGLGPLTSAGDADVFVAMLPP